MLQGNSPLINISLNEKWLIEVLSHVLSWAWTGLFCFNLLRIDNQAEAKSKWSSFDLGICWNTQYPNQLSCLIGLFLIIWCIAYLTFDWKHNYHWVYVDCFFLSNSFVANKPCTVLVRRTEWISFQLGRYSMIDCSLSVMADCCSKTSFAVCPW